MRSSTSTARPENTARRAVTNRKGRTVTTSIKERPGQGSYRSFASFRDPDGNGWQEVTTRLPGRVEADTSLVSATDLAGALRRAAAAHGEHEKRPGGQHGELARLLRRVHRPGAGRRTAAVMSGSWMTSTRRPAWGATSIVGMPCVVSRIRSCPRIAEPGRMVEVGLTGDA
jgi:hypothetical protein